MFVTQMPAINLDALKGALSPEEYALAEKIVATRGQNKGRLRASKPSVKETIAEETFTTGGRTYRHKVRVPDLQDGSAAYVWRMVAFNISPVAQHQCMPVCADFDVPTSAFGGDYDAKRAYLKTLDALADRIIATVPKTEWHGVQRWGRALGYL